MEQLNLTTIPTATLLDDDVETDDEDDRFLPSFTKPTLNLNSTQEFSRLLERNISSLSDADLEDKEWLIKQPSVDTSFTQIPNCGGAEGVNGTAANEFIGSRRGSFIKSDKAEKVIKMIAMACACTFGIGSHFAGHIIGPMKGILMKQLSLTNTQFSLLVASLTLCNTVIPTVSGVLIAKFGTTNSSIVVTSIILLGITIVTAASWSGKVWAMITGFAVFGMGLAPLTIIQETIIVHFFQGHGLGFALATGLTMGRLAAFLASVTTVPLSMMEPFTYRTPFLVATFTCFLSWMMNIIYVLLLKHADNRKNKNREGIALSTVAEKKMVRWSAIFDLSNMFWWYLVVVLLYGSSIEPFLHLSSNIIKHRFATTDLLAAWDASIILLLPVIIYPFLGLFLDKYGKRCSILIVSSLLVLLTYLLLQLPPRLIHPFPPIISFAIAFSLLPLTVVSLVPLLTEHVSTGLGLYKSLNNIGATFSQTIAGLILDAHVKKSNYTIDEDGVEHGHEDDDLVALKMFAILSFLLLLSSLVFWWGDKKYEGGRINSTDVSNHHDTSKYVQANGDELATRQGIEMMVIEDDSTFVKEAMKKQRQRSQIYLGLIALLLITCWLLFAIVAWLKAGILATQ
ncbi:10642_t:CDS:2 [Ambispora leptoticha]|uniref:Lysosomal dipeptide transporter MFSD1 n=1 Tax=Ambispora leptoticha TaxID=144679 RepID=A0A9N8ZC58_9GLOM|nr:10642_t:CDS:2 [Ambispora leptoticha]